ncbi:MAG TPA: hypothetical protein VGK97_02790 [Spongiibacteraceae bacterium]|jgi:hypothetical protein
MLEPLRSHYLAALGIENYVPRRILPGAKLSEPCAWDTNAAAVESPSDIALTHAQGVTPQTPPTTSTQRKSIVEKTVAALVAQTSDKSAAVDATAPQFALSVVIGGGILLLDDAPASNAARTEYQKLLNNFLPALRPAAAQYVLDIFMWPMLKNPQIARDAAAAVETLSAHLSKQIDQRAIDTVLLLGSVAQQWCTMPPSSTIRTLKSISLLACLHDPAQKRQLWNDVRHLAER